MLLLLALIRIPQRASIWTRQIVQSEDRRHFQWGPWGANHRGVLIVEKPEEFPDTARIIQKRDSFLQETGSCVDCDTQIFVTLTFSRTYGTNMPLNAVWLSIWAELKTCLFSHTKFMNNHDRLHAVDIWSKRDAKQNVQTWPDYLFLVDSLYQENRWWTSCSSSTEVPYELPSFWEQTIVLWMASTEFRKSRLQAEAPWPSGLK